METGEAFRRVSWRPATSTTFFRHPTPATPQEPPKGLSMTSLEPLHTIDYAAVALIGNFFYYAPGINKDIATKHFSHHKVEQETHQPQ